MICVERTTMGTEEAGIYQSFAGLPNYYKNFNMSKYYTNVPQISNKFLKNLQQIPNFSPNNNV